MCLQIKGQHSVDGGWASHFIMVDGVKQTYTRAAEETSSATSGATSIALKLEAGQEVTVAPYIDMTLHSKSNAGYLYSWFEVMLIHAD